MGEIRDLAVGSVMGRYELVLRIASGGMGEVWAARLRGSHGFQKVVAIKTLVAELSHDPNFERMFLDEATLAARLKHPNVVEVIDLGEEREVLYQVMEWVEGASLWTVMRAAARQGKKAFPVAVAAGIVAQVCAGLHAAHELKEPDGTSIGLVHRDVSPQNVLITPQGLVKVVDFGVAKFSGRGAAATQVGELRGKVPYMAPEHVHGEELDRRADVFALGILFYQLVSGVHPFLGATDAVTLGRIASAVPPKPLAEVAPQVPAEVAAIVEQALKKSPDERIPTAALLRKMIESAVPAAAGDGCRAAVAEFCHALGSQYFPARSRELRDALRRMDGGAAADGPAGSAPVGRESLASFPVTPPGLTPPTFTPPGLASDVGAETAATEEPVPPPLEEAPAPGRRKLGWIATGGAVLLLGALALEASWKRADPAPGRASSVAGVSASVPAPLARAPAAEVTASGAVTAEETPRPATADAGAADAGAEAIPSARPKPGKGKHKVKPGEYMPEGL